MKPASLPAHVFHLVEASNWPSVQRRGLLSARRLLEEAGPPGRPSDAGGAQAARHRPDHLVLADGTLIRDQAPMPPSALARCLVDGTTPGEWYALLNSWVFFWCDRARLERQAKACAPRPQIMLTLDAERLLARHGARAALTPFNTGFARRQPASRGRSTFVPYAKWLKNVWMSETADRSDKVRPRRHAPVELVVADAVPDVREFIVAAQALQISARVAQSKPKIRRILISPA